MAVVVFIAEAPSSDEAVGLKKEICDLIDESEFSIGHSKAAIIEV